MSDELLSQEQKDKILTAWNANPNDPPSLELLVKLCFGEHAQERSKCGRAVKEFLVTRQLKTQSAKAIKKNEIILTDEQKAFIEHNIDKSSKLEITRYLFNNNNLAPGSMECKSVAKYVDELEPKLKFNTLKNSIPKEEVKAGEGPTINALKVVEESANVIKRGYNPPKNIDTAFNRVNKYILDCIRPEDKEKSSKIQLNLKTLVRFCHQQRFVSMMDSLTDQDDRILFEGRYVSYVWDKPDLSEEELDLYVNLCCDILDNSHMRKEMDRLQTMFQNCADDTEGKRISMSIVESIKNLRKDLDENNKRQRTLIETLQGKRNERIDTRTRQESSLVQLIDYFKSYENRQQMIILAEARKKEVLTEIERLKTLDDVKLQIWGIGPEEVF